MKKMNKLGFEIKVNGEKLCRTGVESDEYIVTSIFNIILRKGEKEAGFSIEVSALDSEKGESVKWVKKTLSKSDKINLEIITGNLHWRKKSKPSIALRKH
jgi:hypothetical protein